MESSAKAAGHPIHQQLVVFPLGLLVTAVVFDVLERITDNADFTRASYLMIAGGILTGMLAAAFGTLDYLAIPAGTRAKRVGRVHGLGNDLVLVLFAASWLLRTDETAHRPGLLALLFGLAAAAISGLTGWLGGELVDRLGVGVDDEAGLDAPTSYETRIKLSR